MDAPQVKECSWNVLNECECMHNTGGEDREH